METQVYIQFTPVVWTDIYSIAGYFAQWAIQHERPMYNHAAIGWDGVYYSMSCNKGVSYDHDTEHQLLVPVPVTKDYAERIIDIFCYRKIKYSRHVNCVTFAATCAGYHDLRFDTADQLHAALTTES